MIVLLQLPVVPLPLQLSHGSASSCRGSAPPVMAPVSFCGTSKRTASVDRRPSCRRGLNWLSAQATPQNPVAGLVDRLLTCILTCVVRSLELLNMASSELTTATAILLCLCTTMGWFVGFKVGRYRPIKTALDISPQDIKANRTLRGLVVSVADGDTIRVRHRPWFSRLRTLNPVARRAEESVLIRVGAVDAPEMPHSGNLGQPFAVESKKFVEASILRKRVAVKLLDRDQYGRLVAAVTFGRWPFRKCLAEELLKMGLAVLYKQQGAEAGYDGKRGIYAHLEGDAKRLKKGLWSQGKDLVLPSDYKLGK
eukprot:TRINITY_DN26065_c0_g1_i2.p1 TRINITY_DN26065_c0_g1~~TRINITY_DN26065_c0_g1_i2.p1  ORF type:complete len:310 (+),score=43.22 TRINITY_DN26065_c0_g1_i2:65-994(+)